MDSSRSICGRPFTIHLQTCILRSSIHSKSSRGGGSRRYHSKSHSGLKLNQIKIKYLFKSPPAATVAHRKQSKSNGQTTVTQQPGGTDGWPRGAFSFNDAHPGDSSSLGGGQQQQQQRSPAPTVGPGIPAWCQGSDAGP